LDSTLEGIRGFVDKYNQVVDYVSGQYQEDPETGKPGPLASDSAVRSVIRGLQTTIVEGNLGGKEYNILADIGIKTNPKTGALDMDDTKVKNALTENYEAVAKLFIRGENQAGVAERLAQKLKAFRDPASGVLRSRIRGLDQVIKNQDETIARKEDQLKNKEQTIRRQFSALEGTMANLNSQADFLKARLGGGGGGQG
jgi:flagellar hook-associated protein 2